VIIRRSTDRVGEWFFSLQDHAEPPLTEEGAFAWILNRIPLVLEILAAARLLLPSRLTIRGTGDRLRDGGGEIDLKSTGWPEALDFISGTVRTQTLRSVLSLAIHGDGWLVETGGGRLLPDLVGIDCPLIGDSTAIVVGTWSDAWLLHDLHGRAQPELQRDNAPRLRAALERIERALGVPGWCDGGTRFAACAGYDLRNRVYPSGAPMGLSDLGCDNLVIAVE
jgi:hypothetical protein